MIRIKSLKDGFRRCGVAHPVAWTEYRDDLFAAEELKRLRAEPMLQVETAHSGPPPGPRFAVEGLHGGDSHPSSGPVPVASALESQPATRARSRKASRPGAAKGADPDGLLHD